MSLQIGERAEVLSFTWNGPHWGAVPVAEPIPAATGDAPIVPLPNKPTLAMIQRLEAELAKLPQVDIPPTHHFADGLYGREITIKAGTVLTGKVHRGEHLNFLMKGDITVWTEEGMKRIQAPAVIVSKPGTKRVGYAHTDTTWITVHASKERDLEALEAELIVPEFPAIEHGDAR